MEPLFRFLPILLLLAFSPPGFSAAQYAIIVTINDYPGVEDDLHGCNHDGDLIETMLVDRYHFPSSNIVRLRDTQATTAAVRKAIQQHLAAKARPGDAALLYFSGHGTQVPDFDGDEPDDMDECLCTYDIDPTRISSWLTDDVLRREIAAIKTSRLSVMLDCCHSGTGTRGALSGAAEGIRYRDLGFARPAALQQDAGVKTTMRRPSDHPGHVLFAACAEREVTREFKMKDNFGGLFTAALMIELELRGDSTPLSAMFTEMRRELTELQAAIPKFRRQTPEFEGNSTLTMNDLLGASPAPAPPPTPALPPSKPSPAPPIAANEATLAGDMSVALATDKTSYVAGEKMTVTVRLQKDAHLRLYYTDGDQKSFLIFPNRFHPTDDVKANEEVKVPGPAANFAFEMTFPSGRGGAQVAEVLTAIASTLPFSDTRGLHWDDGNFLEVTGPHYHEVVTRGIRLIPDLRLGRASVIYRVRPLSASSR